MIKIIYFTSLILCLFLLAHPVASRTKKEWKTRVIYQLLTDRFARSDGDKSECDLHKYCGGDFKGIMENLDYITGMGFNAIWISPVLKNTPDSYHGYHMTDLEKININFGTAEELKELIKFCHDRDVWVMVDVVANHVGPVGLDYSEINPFNEESHYHKPCDIHMEDFQTNQWVVEVFNHLIIEL
jgi:alpha-amylase